MLKKIRECLSQRGQGIVEYALILGFVAVVTVGLFSNDGLKDTFRETLASIMNQFTKYNAAYSSADTSSNNLVVPPGDEDEEAD